MVSTIVMRWKFGFGRRPCRIVEIGVVGVTRPQQAVAARADEIGRDRECAAELVLNAGGDLLRVGRAIAGSELRRARNRRDRPAGAIRVGAVRVRVSGVGDQRLHELLGILGVERNVQEDLVVVDAGVGAQHRAPAAADVPHHSQSGREVVAIVIDADHVLVVPPQPEVDGQPIRRPPLILDERRVDVVIEVDDRVTDVPGELRRVGRGHRRIERHRGGERERAIEVVVELGEEIDEAGVDARLERVAAPLIGNEPVEGVGDLDAVFSAALRHVARLAEAEPRAVHGRAVRAVLA